MSGRIYTEAVIMGLLIGMAVALLNTLLSRANIWLQLLGLVVLGGLLCLVQYGLARLRKG